MKSLDERLVDVRTTLDELGTLLVKHAGIMPTVTEDQFRRSIEAAAGLQLWRELIVARDAARAFLDGMETRADGDDLVDFGGRRVKFAHVRLIGVGAYLSLSWSLADRISAMVGRILCTIQGGAMNEQSPAKLVSHFVLEERTKETTAGVAFDSVRQTFGWPIGISYAIRNHFVHDGGTQKEVEFFAGNTSAAAFQISDDGWRYAERRAHGYSVRREFSRAGNWPATPTDDLRAVLLACEREMDDALGILLGSASKALTFHVGYMLGQD